MATVGLTFSTGVPSTVGALELDALLTEGTELSAKATEYAVEEGSPISDHVVLESEQLKLSGWITPSNVQQLTAAGRPKMLEAKAALRKMINDRAEITVSTGMDTYTGMIMEKCSIGRSNEGDHFSVDMQFIKIRKAVLRKVDIPPGKTSGTATGKAGSTNTKAGKAGTGNTAPPTGPQQSKLRTLVRS